MAYSFQNFAVGDILTEAKMDQIEINIRDHKHGANGVNPLFSETVVKSSNTDIVSSTSLNDDPHLQIALSPGTFLLDLICLFGPVSSMDQGMNYDFNITSGLVNGAWWHVEDSSATYNSVTKAFTDWVATPDVITAISPPRIVRAFGAFEVTGTPTIKFRWGQVYSSATALRLLKGSCMTARQTS